MFRLGDLEVKLGVIYLEPSVNGLDHHLHCSQGVGPASVLSPENPVLVLASVMATSVPYTIEVRVCTGIVPPASFMKVGAVSCRRNTDREVKVLPLQTVKGMYFIWSGLSDWLQQRLSWFLGFLRQPQCSLGRTSAGESQNKTKLHPLGNETLTNIHTLAGHLPCQKP